MAASRTLLLLCQLDRGPRACYASRQSIARQRGSSLSAINHQIAQLKRMGYISVERKGQKAGQPGVIRVPDQVRNALLSAIQKNANSHPDANEGLQEDANSHPDTIVNLQDNVNLHTDASPYHIIEDCCCIETTTKPSKEDAVLPLKPVESEQSKAENHNQASQALITAGLDDHNAHQLAQTHPPDQCLAAVAYVRDRSSVKNPAGYIRYLLESDAEIPKRYHPAPKSPKPAPLPKPVAPDPDREQRRQASPHHGLWSEISTRIRDRIQPQSFESWIAPLFISEIKDHTLVIDAPGEFFADWIKEHYLWLIKDAFRVWSFPISECHSAKTEMEICITAGEMHRRY